MYTSWSSSYALGKIVIHILTASGCDILNGVTSLVDQPLGSKAMLNLYIPSILTQYYGFVIETKRCIVCTTLGFYKVAQLEESDRLK